MADAASKKSLLEAKKAKIEADLAAAGQEADMKKEREKLRTKLDELRKSGDLTKLQGKLATKVEQGKLLAAKAEAKKVIQQRYKAKLAREKSKLTSEKRKASAAKAVRLRTLKTGCFKYLASWPARESTGRGGRGGGNRRHDGV